MRQVVLIVLVVVKVLLWWLNANGVVGAVGCSLFGVCEVLAGNGTNTTHLISVACDSTVTTQQLLVDDADAADAVVCVWMLDEHSAQVIAPFVHASVSVSALAMDTGI